MTHEAVSFPPIVAPKPRTLILGSMPGVKSLEERQYYAHPRNSFWRIMGLLFEAPVASYAERRALIKGNALALWDVLKSCTRRGSLDADIRNAEANDFAAFLKKHSGISRVFFNGAMAEKEFRKRVLPLLPEKTAARLELKRLPSTSPAYAGLGAARKQKEWSIIKGK
ncbi:MAG: DNA-deoxyinosine glycosylase [Alphaproteobacteria bacterium]|nr:DNA-deoxyinosine glycosylase [Alphaproteobacteria bacterium]